MINTGNRGIGVNTENGGDMNTPDDKFFNSMIICLVSIQGCPNIVKDRYVYGNKHNSSHGELINKILNY